MLCNKSVVALMIRKTRFGYFFIFYEIKANNVSESLLQDKTLWNKSFEHYQNCFSECLFIIFRLTD